MAEPLLQVRDLVTSFQVEEGSARAVDGVSFEVYPGETLGLVGESGCGKSVTALSILRLVPEPPGRIEAGSILYRGGDLLALPAGEMRRIRGNEISMVFQEPMTSLNPVFTCGEQIREAIMLHQRLGKKAARERAIEMLRKVRIPGPEQRFDEYPHQLSGGMRQRVMIAMALSCNPSLLIADEPTTALDVTIQAQILDLLRELQEELNMAVLMISHDLGVIAEIANRVVVMYAGTVVEEGAVEALFQSPRHPYTRGLLESLPRLEVTRKRLAAIPGRVPSPVRRPPGCRFSNRCRFVEEPECTRKEPELEPAGEGQRARCWKWDRLGEPAAGGREAS
jgi:oligopeptide/dipeptide ABC transporter ATP-binding protein